MYGVLTPHDGGRRGTLRRKVPRLSRRACVVLRRAPLRRPHGGAPARKGAAARASRLSRIRWTRERRKSESSVKFDAVVVGAGPSGSTAARELAQRGARVLLLDRARFPRDKPCGGGVTIRAADLLPFDLSPVVERTVRGVHISLA